MKAYNDIDQSKKLAEILPIESADCYWDYDEMQKFHRISWFEDGFNKHSQLLFNENNVCAWSLAALLEQIPSDLGSATLTIEKDDSELLKYGLNYHDRWGREDDVQTKYYDDLVDACVEMIVKLHKLKFI